MVSPKYPCASAVSILIWEQAEQAPVHLSMILRWPGFQSDATHKWNFVGILLSNQSDFKNPELIFAWRFQQVAARGKSLSVPRTNFPIIILTIEIAGATTRIQITAGSKKTLFIVQKKTTQTVISPEMVRTTPWSSLVHWFALTVANAAIENNLMITFCVITRQNYSRPKARHPVFEQTPVKEVFQKILASQRFWTPHWTSIKGSG